LRQRFSVQYTKGMIVAAIANRTVDKARQAFVEAGVDESQIREVTSAEELAAVNASG
jgi:predicted homoserine dehydrogenase-like protein